MKIGERLKSLRLKNELTQEQLAHKVNLTKANISKYESDSIEPNITTLTLLSEIFNVSVAYLLCETDDPSPPDKSKPDIRWGEFGISFYGTPTDEDKEMIIDSINFAMEQRRKRNEAKLKDQKERDKNK